MSDLKFYYHDQCPFCVKVMRYMDKNKIEVQMMHTRKDPKNQEELIKLGGKNQVPMLLIDGQPLYESDYMIQWFKNNM